jgi:hypothetical protein
MIASRFAMVSSDDVSSTPMMLSPAKAPSTSADRQLDGSGE